MSSYSTKAGCMAAEARVENYRILACHAVVDVPPQLRTGKGDSMLRN